MVRERHRPEPLVVEEYGDLAPPVGPAFDVRVHDRPAAGIVAAVERDPERLAQAAVHAVARHQEARPHLLGADPGDDAVLVLPDELDRPAALHLPAEVIAKQAFELTLAQAHGGRERAVDPPEVEARYLAAAREERNGGDRKGGGQHL